MLLEHISNSPSLKAGQEDGVSLFCKAMREKVRLWLGSQGFSQPIPLPGCPCSTRTVRAQRPEAWELGNRVLGLGGS